MNYQMIELLAYIKNKKISNFKHVALLFSKYAMEKEDHQLAESIYNQSIEIDLHELESLTNPDKFSYPKGNIGVIGVEDV